MGIEVRDRFTVCALRLQFSAGKRHPVLTDSITGAVIVTDELGETKRESAFAYLVNNERTKSPQKFISLLKLATDREISIATRERERDGTVHGYGYNNMRIMRDKRVITLL